MEQPENSSEASDSLPNIMEDDEDRLDEGAQMNDHMGGLSTLLEKMRDPKCGIEVKNRTWHARTYETCFVGSEAVDWMVRTLELPSREDAVAIGQSLMYRGIIQHVCNSEPFADHYFFYSFTEDIKQKKLARRKIAARPEIYTKLQFDEAKIDELGNMMSSPDKGVEIKNRKYHFRTYETCFVGSEAVRWLLSQRVCPIRTAEEAVAIGQLLIDRGVIHHVVNRQPFKDGYFFYRFYKHESKYKKIESKSKDKDILALLQAGQEPELEDSMEWAEKMLKLLVKLELVDKFGILPHSKLNMLWSSPDTRRDQKLGFLKILEKYLLSYRFDAHQSLIPRLLKDEQPAIVNSTWKKTAKLDRVCREFVFRGLPDHFFSEFIVCFLRFQVDTIAMHYWQSGLFIISSTAKVLMKGTSKTIRFEGCGTNLERLLTIANECVFALVDPVKTGTPTVECYLVRDGKDSDSILLPQLCEAIFKNAGALDLGKSIRSAPLSAIAPDLMMLDAKPGWVIKWSDLQLKKQIGAGGFARVHAAEWNGRSVAVKEFLDPKAFMEFRREVTIMSELCRHANITQLCAISTSPPALVMQFCEFGDLRSFIAKGNANSWKAKLRVASDVASGLAFMHSCFPRIIHKDLKPQNILMVSESPTCEGAMAVIADFGTARYLVSTVRVTEVENPVYLAPEVLRKQPFTERSDVYAFGSILWQLIADPAAEPFVECRFAYQVEDAIKAGQRPAMDPQTQVAKAYAQLLQSVWDDEPLRRPTMATAIEVLHQLQASEAADAAAFSAAFVSYGSIVVLAPRKASVPPPVPQVNLFAASSSSASADRSSASFSALSPNEKDPKVESARRRSVSPSSSTRPPAFSAANFIKLKTTDSNSDLEESNAVQEIKVEKKNLEDLLKKGNFSNSASSPPSSGVQLAKSRSSSNSLSNSSSSNNISTFISSIGESMSNFRKESKKELGSADSTVPPLSQQNTILSINSTFNRSDTTTALPKTSPRP